MNKIKRTKLMLLTILIFTILTGFVCTFATAKENQRSTKLAFNAIEWVDNTFIPPITPFPFPPPPPIMFVEDGVLHMKGFCSVHLLDGSVGDEEITNGYTMSLFHAKIPLDPTTGAPDFGNMLINGQTWFYFTSDDKSGYFTGTLNGKFVNGVLSGKFTLHGFEDFDKMKLFGRFNNIDPITNELYGTVLIPN